MFDRIKLFILKRVYKFLILRIELIDKARLPKYELYKEFCTMHIDSNKGVFVFVFKKDRRNKDRVDYANNLLKTTNYFVELIPPPGLRFKNDDLQNKVVMVVKLGISSISHKVLASLMLDLYIDCFNEIDSRSSRMHE